MERLRLADGVLVILKHRYVVHEHGPKLIKAQAEGSLYRAWTETHLSVIAGANEIIRAVLPTMSEARHLQISPITPVLEMLSVGLLESNMPLWWERSLYRAECENILEFSKMVRSQSICLA